MKRGRLLATGALALVMVALALYGGGNVVRVWQMNREVNALEHELQLRRAETDCLTRTVDQLREDPAQIEKLAREELGYVKKGEKVLKFPSAPATPERTC